MGVHGTVKGSLLQSFGYWGGGEKPSWNISLWGTGLHSKETTILKGNPSYSVGGKGGEGGSRKNLGGETFRETEATDKSKKKNLL